MRAPLRLFPLSLSIAACLAGPAAAADDKPLNWALCPAGDIIPPFNGAPPAAQPGDPAREEQPTVIEGDEQSGTRTTPQIQGNVALTRGDQFLGTDHLKFDTESGDYVAEGNVRYQDSGIRIIAERAEGNQNTDIHTISDIRYQLVDRRGNGGADSIRLTGPLGQMRHSTYSTCDPSQQLWELRAQRIDVDSDEGFGVARNAVLRMGKFPVLYVPWFKFPVDDRRLTDPAFRFAGDGVHANTQGQWVMARELLRHLGAPAALADASGPDALIAAHPKGGEILKLVQQRQRVLKDAWLTAVGHNRPGMGKGKAKIRPGHRVWPRRPILYHGAMRRITARAVTPCCSATANTRASRAARHRDQNNRRHE